MARGAALAAAVAVALLAVSGAGGATAQTPKRGGTIVVGTQAAQGGGREPACLNALLASCNTSAWATYIAQKALEGAFEPQPNWTWRKRLVSDVEYTTESPFTLTYHIRPEARWSDGVPVSARDFVFTHRASVRLRDDLFVTEIVDQVRSVRAVDAKTVRVVLRSRFAGWRALFHIVLPQHALAGEDVERVWNDRIDNPKTGTPIGSGPFLVQRWERGSQVTLVRNPRYWGARRASLDRLVVRFKMSSLEPAAWFRSGEVDVAQNFPVVGVQALRREAGVRIVPGPTSAYEHFTFRLGRGGHPALRNKLVRRALAFGLDRQALIRGSAFGDADPTLRPLDSLAFFQRSPYYKAKWSGHNPQAARRLLEQAGCRRGADGIYSCDGERLSLGFRTPSGFPNRARVLALAQEQLRQIGVEAEPSFSPGPALFNQILPSGDFDVAYFAWNKLDPSTGGQHGTYGCGGFQNFGGYCQRLVTRELDQANRILDPAKQARALNRADAQMARDVPVIPLFQVPLPAAVRTSIRGFGFSPFNPFWGAENWWLAR